MAFYIKEDYISRSQYHHHDDRTFTDGSQNEVYSYAYELLIKNNYKNVIDIGCGSAFKLMKYFNEFNTIGYEIEPTLSYLRDTYPKRQWRNSDPQNSENSTTDILICADVIEHLVDPNTLFKFIKQFKYKILILSTPDRDKLMEIQHDYQSQTGPPINPSHVREWNFSELENYVGSNFEVIEHFHSKSEFWNQVIVCQQNTHKD